MCRKETAQGEDCSWYHGSWQYFRALGIVSAPDVHHEMLTHSLRALARTRQHPRVLVSGSTDYSLLAHVLWAYRLENAPVVPTVVDFCETPLYMCRWYADWVGATIETAASDILDYEVSEPFDVICTHAFLGYFDPDGRRRLVAQWRKLLRPGGQIVTIQRIRPDAGDAPVRFSPEQASAFRNNALDQAEKQQDHLDVAPELIADMAQVFTARFSSYPIRSQQELADLFTAGGFRLDQYHVHKSDLSVSHPCTGPSIPANAEFVHLVASRI